MELIYKGRKLSLTLYKENLTNQPYQKSLSDMLFQKDCFPWDNQLNRFFVKKA